MTYNLLLLSVMVLSQNTIEKMLRAGDRYRMAFGLTGKTDFPGQAGDSVSQRFSRSRNLKPLKLSYS